MWQEAIADIEEVAKKEVAALKEVLDSYRKTNEKLFRKSKHRILESFEKTVMQRAIDTVDDAISARALKVNVAQAMLDIQKGIVYDKYIYLLY